jgi:cellobiose-specific phosphotransferase system component IIC
MKKYGKGIISALMIICIISPLAQYARDSMFKELQSNSELNSVASSSIENAKKSKSILDNGNTITLAIAGLISCFIIWYKYFWNRNSDEA